MNKITHGIFLIFIVFLLLCSTKVEAQYQNSNSNKMPLSFISSQYWQNSNTAENDSVMIVENRWFPRTAHKFAIGLLYGTGGALIGLAGGAGLTSLANNSTFMAMIPAGYVFLSALGVKSVSDDYGDGIEYGSYTLILLGGVVGFIAPYLIGNNEFSLVDSHGSGNSDTILAKLISSIFLTVISEIAVSELVYTNAREPDLNEDEYIYNETDKLVFHEYVKTTQVFNFELFRIQL